jgi:hypothetical protein
MDNLCISKPLASLKATEWARQDLNLRPPGYQPGAPTNLSYPPSGEQRHRGTQLNGSDEEIILLLRSHLH